MSPSLVALLKDKYSLADISSGPSGDLEVFVSSSRLLEFLAELKSKDGAEFVHLADLSAYEEDSKVFVFYELISMQAAKRIRVVVEAEKMSMPTATKLWAGASWLEREAFDMFGVVFEGHDDLRRILLPPSFVGHPLRKDFVVDYRQEYDASDEGEVFDPFGNNIVTEGASS